MKKKCCVPHCESRRNAVILHRFPKTEIGLNKWLQKCSKSGDFMKFSSEELHKMFVCHKHFEKRFVTAKLRLRQSAYPTLFSPEEINTGIPLAEEIDSENFTHSLDHNYYYTQSIERQKHNDHAYCKQRRSPLRELLAQENTVLYINEPSTSSKPVTEGADDEFKHNNILTETTVPHSTTLKVSRKPYINKNKLNPVSLKLLAEYKKAKRKVNFLTRAKKAMKLSKMGLFEKLTAGVHPLTKKIIWMQISQATKATKGRRFSDDEKLIALAIMKQGPKTYKFLRRIFILPSVRTINKMIERLKVDSGINTAIFDAIKSEVQNWPESKKYCNIIFDEVALEPGLSYDKHKDKISGFVELNTISNNYADHALAFMVRGALHKWQQPIGFYFCEGATSSNILKNILKEVVNAVTNTGLLPVAIVCDQGTAFQSAINKLKEETRRSQILLNEDIDNTVKIGKQNMFVMYDPPHLIKGIRNNFITKNIKYGSKLSKWSDIVDVYNTDCKHADMRMLHKLNDEYVIPEKIKKMKVRNCTRVLSKTVASALAYTANFSHYADGNPVSDTLKHTSETVSFFDDLFDSCNGANISSKNKGKPLRQAVTKKSQHVTFWKSAIEKLEKIRFINNKGREVMVPSQKNFILTLKSLTSISQFFEKKGFKIMRPKFFNSDPIENFFGQVRAYSYRNNDPNCQSFKNIFRSLLITRFINFHSQSFNCEDTSGDQIIKLKNLFTSNNSEDKVNESTLTLSSENLITEKSPEGIENIVDAARKQRISVHSRAYTVGWVIRKCMKKFQCVECKKYLTQNNESTIHQWISHREFKNFKNKHKLTYPTENALRYFSDIVKESNEYLESHPNKENISKEIMKGVAKYSFDFFNCLRHKKAFQQYFVIITVKLCVINWCNTINKILKGTDVSRLRVGGLPNMQRKALSKFKKKLRNKKINK